MTVPFLVSTGVIDEEYQTWAEKVYDAKDDDAISKGATVSCVFCNIVITATKKQMVLNKERPRAERYTEEQIEEVLLELCDNVSGRIAKALQGYKKDAMMICRRVVSENLPDMLDAASLGEDIESYCKEHSLCPMSNDQFASMIEMAGKAMQDSEGGSKKDDDEDDDDPGRTSDGAVSGNTVEL